MKQKLRSKLSFLKRRKRTKKCEILRLKKYASKIYSFFSNKEIYVVLSLSIPFVIMDLFIRCFGSDISFFPVWSVSPRLFSLSYIFLLVGLVYNIGCKYNKIIYFLCYIVFLFLFLTNCIYYDTSSVFFDFSILELAGEGSAYFWDAIVTCNVWVYITTAILIGFFFFTFKIFPKDVGLNKKRIFAIIIIFFLGHFIAKISLGQENFELTWNTWRTPRNIYNNFNDSNKCMAISGFYEYTFRSLYTTYLKPKEKQSETENKFLEEVFDVSNDSYKKNNYTGIFKNKNVIFLQLEGIDDWLLSKEFMPNTYNLLNNSINFTNHYSFYNGGGSTFNSEFAVNVGYMTPFTYPQNAYSLNKNDFSYSLANLLKEQNYSIKAFHMNSSEYYSRGINYKNWGYDHYFGLMDLKYYSDKSYQLDRELILNPIFNEEIFNNESKFANYIITYSNHMPFNTKAGVCKRLMENKYADTINDMSKREKEEFLASLNLSEETCIKLQAQETDYMVGLLMKTLKEKDLYKDTIIVAFADHYLYTVTDENILKKYGKKTENNLINHTPFFIWSHGLKKVNVNKVTSQINILPTVLNLLGIEYNEKWYTGTDALSKNYSGIAIFSDLSWYDGNIYVQDGKVINGKKISNEKFEEKMSMVEYIVKKNDLVLKYNYFKQMNN